MKYWSTHKRALIYKVLQKYHSEAIEALVWQQEHENRVQFQAYCGEYQENRYHIELEGSVEELFDTAKPFYVHIPQNHLIYKKDRYLLLGKTLEFNPPSVIQMMEKRKNERFTFKYQDHKNISFSLKKRETEKDEPPHLSCVLLDVSVSGAAFVLDKKDKQLLNIGTQLYMENITDQKIPDPFRTIVRNILIYEGSEEGLLRVGVEFDVELDSVSYRSITSVVEKKKKRMEGIRPGCYCGLNEEEQEKILNQIYAQNAVLSNNIRSNLEFLDRLRYMTASMKVDFFKEIGPDLLANSLRLSSKELIYDLLSEISTNMQEEFLEKLAIEKSAAGICKAQDKVMALIQQKEGSGEYVFDPKAFVTYV